MTIPSANGQIQAAINVTPMIDVLLVLLIIFMAIAPEKSSGLDALLPQSSLALPRPESENPIILEITGDGLYRLNSERVERSSLGAGLVTIFARRSDSVLFVVASPGLEFSVVADALDTAHGANIDRVALMPR